MKKSFSGKIIKTYEKIALLPNLKVFPPDLLNPVPLHEQRKVSYFLGCVEKFFEPPKNEKNDTNTANNVKYMKINISYQIFFT